MVGPRVIVVDDEAGLRQMLMDYLSRHGFAVRAAADGAELDACLAREPADLLILDVNMPHEDGFAIARRVRAAGPMPILMLTAADEVVDRVVGLELGADDYMTKPFDLRELRARIGAVLRRMAAAPVSPAPAAPASPLVQFGETRLDLESHRLVHGDGSEIPLTATEFDLLRAFAQNPGRVLSRDRLLDLTSRDGAEPFDRSIDIRITRLRRKVEADPAHPLVIRTVRGSGYMFVPPKP